MPNMVVNGLGYRRTGTVNRPNNFLLSEFDFEVVATDTIELEAVVTDEMDFEVNFQD